MSDRGGAIVGGALILFGILALLGKLLDVRLGHLFWPLLLIAAGVFVLLRPRMNVSGAPISMHFLGGERRGGQWAAGHEEIWSFIGDITLDLRQAEIEPGEIHYRILSFVVDIDLIVPSEVGVSVSSVGLVSEATMENNRMGGFLSPVNWSSQGYAQAESKVRLELISFVGELQLRRR